MASETLIKIGLRFILIGIIFVALLYGMQQLTGEPLLTNKISLVVITVIVGVIVLSFWGAQQFKTKVEVKK